MLSRLRSSMVTLLSSSQLAFHAESFEILNGDIVEFFPACSFRNKSSLLLFILPLVLLQSFRRLFLPSFQISFIVSQFLLLLSHLPLKHLLHLPLHLTQLGNMFLLLLFYHGEWVLVG